MIKEYSITVGAAYSEATWRKVKAAGRCRVKVTDDRLIAANVLPGSVLCVRFNDAPLPGELSAVRYADGRVDVAFVEVVSRRLSWLIPVNGDEPRHMTSRECSIIGRVNLVIAPQAVLRVSLPHRR